MIAARNRRTQPAERLIDHHGIAVRRASCIPPLLPSRSHLAHQHPNMLRGKRQLTWALILLVLSSCGHAEDASFVDSLDRDASAVDVGPALSEQQQHLVTLTSSDESMLSSAPAAEESLALYTQAEALRIGSPLAPRNATQALLLYRQAAALQEGAGSANALAALARMYEHGWDGESDLVVYSPPGAVGVSSWRHWRHTLHRIPLLGRLVDEILSGWDRLVTFLERTGVTSSIPLALPRVATLDTTAAVQPALLIPHNMTEAVRLYREASALGNATASFTVGVLHAHGLFGVRPDERLAVRTAAHALRRLYPRAAHRCCCYVSYSFALHRCCTDRLHRQILHYYFAALGGSLEAQIALGLRHAEGHGTPRHCASAVLYLEKAARTVADTVAASYGLLQSAPQPYRERLSLGAMENLESDATRKESAIIGFHQNAGGWAAVTRMRCIRFYNCSVACNTAA